MFETQFGNGIAKKLFDELKDKSVIFVTQENLLEKYRAIVPESFIVQCIDNIEESYITELNNKLPFAEIIIGFGGGLSVDGAKYFAWKRNTCCYLLPTAISVDACYSYPIALRRNSVVCYEGEVLPEQVLIDYEIIRTAPKMLNLSGVGDLLSCYTGLFDWTLMTKAGKGNPVVQRQYEGAQKILDELFASADDIAQMTDKGIAMIMKGYKWVGVEGYNSRYCHFEEGSEHYLAYAVESVCGKHLLHGQLVCMCAYIMSKLQSEGRQKAVSDFTKAIGLSIIPADVGLSDNELFNALKIVNNFALTNNLSYSILNEKQITDEFINEVLMELNT